MDKSSIHERVVEVYHHGPEAVLELIVELLTEQAARMESVLARVVALEAENALLRARLGTDSHNSRSRW